MWRRIGLILLLVLALSPFYYPYIAKDLFSAWRWIKNFGKNPNYPVYKSYRIRIPIKYPVHGIDVSFYQGFINWQKVKLMRQDSVHIDFAYIKATEGIVRADPYFSHNWRGCKQTGIVCGAYHYFRPKFSGKLQARFFVKNITVLRGDLPPVVDVEELDGVTPEKMRTELDAFIAELETQTNVRPMIYSSLKFYYDNLFGYYDTDRLWLSNFDSPNLVVGPETKWLFWQHSNHARVNGILSPVDFDLFNGDSVALRKILIK